MTILFLVLLCGIADMLRGWGLPYIGKAAGFVYGLSLGVLLTWNTMWDGWLLVLGCSVLWWLGEKPGWGWPSGWLLTGKRPDTWDINAEPEDWQFTPWLRETYYGQVISMLLRGAIWAAPVMLLCTWETSFIWLLPAAMTGMLSPCIARWIPWQKAHCNEFIRGVVIAGLVLTGVLIY